MTMSEVIDQHYSARKKKKKKLNLVGEVSSLSPQTRNKVHGRGVESVCHSLPRRQCNEAANPRKLRFWGSYALRLTFPNTTCLPSSHSAFAVVMKNWQPLVFGPLFAIDNSPGPASAPNIGAWDCT